MGIVVLGERATGLLIQIRLRVGVLHEVAGFDFVSGSVQRCSPALKLPLI
jgi:hypothetical protein